MGLSKKTLKLYGIKKKNVVSQALCGMRTNHIPKEYIRLRDFNQGIKVHQHVCVNCGKTIHMQVEELNNNN